jgi:ribonuclease-3
VAALLLRQLRQLLLLRQSRRLTADMTAAREELEAKLGYEFRNRELLQRALTHRSSLEGRSATETQLEDNEQLEFLGDSVLGFVVSEALVLAHRDAREGQLSRWKAHLVSAAHLYVCALALGLGEYLVLGRGEEKNGGRARLNLLSDAMEALIAALYLDGGMAPAKAFIERNILQAASNLDEAVPSNNQKVELQQRARAMGLPPPRYQVIAEEGPDHSKMFIVEVTLGEGLSSRAEASTKKMASLIAARMLLHQLEAADKS